MLLIHCSSLLLCKAIWTTRRSHTRFDTKCVVVLLPSSSYSPLEMLPVDIQSLRSSFHIKVQSYFFWLALMLQFVVWCNSRFSNPPLKKENNMDSTLSSNYGSFPSINTTLFAPLQIQVIIISMLHSYYLLSPLSLTLCFDDNISSINLISS